MSSSDDTTGYIYDAQFLDYADRASARSAQRVSSLLLDVFPIESVLDVGCAQGTWLRVWQQSGVDDVFGIDGDYVDQDRLKIPANHFTAQDISQPFDLERQFDLVQCLEVGEHIPEEHARTLVDNLTRHGSCVLFSAAPPGQGGEYHVNEQPYEYWRKLFREKGYLAFDLIRPHLRNDKEIAVWYRHNTFLFLHSQTMADLPEKVQATAVPDGTPLSDVSPLTYRLRKQIVRRLPFPMQQVLARVVARIRR